MTDADFYELFCEMLDYLRNLVGTVGALVEEVRGVAKEVRELRKSAEVCGFGGPV